MPWSQIGDKLTPEIIGVVMSMLIAVIRVLYDREETRLFRIFLEAMLCGGLAVAASSGIQALGWDESWSVFAGSSIRVPRI